MLDIAESGIQIGEKLYVLLSNEQRKELCRFLLEAEPKANKSSVVLHRLSEQENPLTEIQTDNLYFCLAHRHVEVCGQPISLTVKEFEILALLIRNPKRVFTYEMLMDLVWHEDHAYYSRKAVQNHISNLRKKLQLTPNMPAYIKTVGGVGYKFDGL